MKEKIYYNKQYYRSRRNAIILGIISILLLVPFLVTVVVLLAINIMFGTAVINVYNATVFYALLFIWMLATIILGVNAIKAIRSTIRNKIPLKGSPEDSGVKRYVSPQYYKLRNIQVIFGIIAAVSFNVAVALAYVWIVPELGKYTIEPALVNKVLVILALYFVALIGLIVSMANRKKKYGQIITYTDPDGEIEIPVPGTTNEKKEDESEQVIFFKD